MITILPIGFDSAYTKPYRHGTPTGLCGRADTDSYRHGTPTGLRGRAVTDPVTDMDPLTGITAGSFAGTVAANMDSTQE